MANDDELCAVPLGPPPLHGEFIVSVVDENGTARSTAEYRFNCYDADGKVP